MEDIVSKLTRVLRSVDERRADPMNPVSVNVGVVVHLGEDNSDCDDCDEGVEITVNLENEDDGS